MEWNGSAYGACKETKCNTGYQMVSGKCEPCGKPNALTYVAGGNCLIGTCVSGYHPENGGQNCANDVAACEIPNATLAMRTYADGQWGECTVVACANSYHLSSNACVRNVKACVISNGTGEMEWIGDPQTGSWGPCQAASCDSGYTSDPTLTNDRSQPCGVCKNFYGLLGERAVSTYSHECEIASCMYQGEQYALENNECVPLCDANGLEDETGIVSWNPNAHKCEVQCKAGYMCW
jgi:hypothetical protein